MAFSLCLTKEAVFCYARSMPIHQSTLKNGVRLVVAPMTGTETATVLAMFGTGSRAEVPTEMGIAHFTEHLFFKGTPKRPTTLDVAAAIEDVGGEFNAFTDKEHTAYYTKLPAKHLERGFDFISDLVSHPLLPEDEVEREKSVIIEEINMYEDTPMRNVAEIIDTTVWGDTPMGWPIAGTRETVTAISRQQVADFIKTHYTAENLVLVITGNVTEQNVQELAAQYFGQLPSPAPAKPVAATLTVGPRQMIKTKATEQTHFVLAFPTFAISDPRRPILRVLATLLGGGMSSRLFISVRERQGLCYYIHAQAQQFSDTGLLQIQAGVDTTRLNQALQATAKEVARLKSELAEPAELQRAKEIIKGRLLIRMEDSEELANLFANQLSTGQSLQTPDDLIAQIDNVTSEQVKTLAEELFVSPELSLATVGPVKAEEITTLSV